MSQGELRGVQGNSGELVGFYSYWWYVESADPDLNADILVVVVGVEDSEVNIETLLAHRLEAPLVK